ncbi:MAG: SusC/RagA family TonB-linked outer membrane protein [Puia sp.]|nr:SusC/RagA family TonB-linked outer membrane protein [Puia sp.]
MKKKAASLVDLMHRKFRLSTKTLLVMKLSTILLLAAGLQVSARGFSQKISLSGKDVPLEKIISSIEKQSDFAFFVDRELIQSVKVTVEIKDANIEQALNECLKNQPLDFKIVEKTIFIKEKINQSITRTSPSTAPPPPDVLINIKGQVLDENQKPLQDASIEVIGSKQGISTDANGMFELKQVNTNAVIKISYTGFTPIEMSLKGKTFLTIALSRGSNPLDQVQVIAYGTTTKRLSTGDVTTVTSKEIEEQPVSNVLGALEGRVPGLLITQTTGAPGGGFTVQLRGQNSIANGNNPFYVIDGVPYNSQIPALPGNSSGLINPTLQGGNPLNYINPYDVESIEVLKDADATSIYGSRAANGAILITTKKGKAGRMQVDLNVNSGFQQPSRDIQMLDTKQYLAARHEAFNNDGETPQSYDYDVNGTWDTTRYTNWSKVLTENKAHYTDAQASLSGGTTNTQYLFGAGYNTQSTPFPTLHPSGADQKASVHVGLNSQSNDNKFKLAFTGSYVSDNNTVQSEDYSFDRIFLAPDAPALFNSDGSLNWAPLTPGQAGTWTNPYGPLNSIYKQNTSNLIGNTVLSYTILPNWELRSSFGYTMTRTDEVQASPTTVYDPGDKVTSGSSHFNSIKNNSWIIEPQTNYKLQLSRGLLTVLFGSTFEQNNSAIQKLAASGFVSDALIENIQAASHVSTASNSAQYKYNAFFGRVNYNWEDKYLLNLTGRRDGSSRFGPGRQFGNFGSVGAAWIFSRENLIQKNISFLSFGKLRASYGTTGNDAIGDYQYFDLYTTTRNPYGGVQGLYPINLSNQNLAWEINKKMEGGLELGFFKDRIVILASYYRNRSSNQLVSMPVSLVTGFISIPSNLPALVQNAGKELVVNTVNIKSKDFTWSSSFNLTISKNKLVAFPNFTNSAYSNYLIIGQPLNVLRLYHLLGINDTTGVYQFADSKGAPTYNPDYLVDRPAIVNTAPKFFGGFQNSFQYKNISLSFLFQFVKQKGETLFGAYSNLAGSMGNMPVIFLNRWQKSGDKATYQKFSQDYSSAASNAFNYAQASDFAYGDASFIRLKNVAISWQMSNNIRQKLHLKGCRIYLQGQNLLTKTHYDGIDPETQGTALPPMRVFTTGFQMTL